MHFSFVGVTFRTGTRLFFEGMAWNVRDGEHWAVVGGTGAGKTLLARAICRELPLLRGEVLYSGGEGEDERPFPRSRDIRVFSTEAHRAFMRGFVQYAQGRFQSLEGEGVPTVRQVLASPGGRRVNPILRKKLIDEFGLEGLMRRPMHLLSHGESRKVFLARLLLDSPRLLILDEPNAGLDAGARAVFSELIQKILASGGPQLIFMTSRPEEIPAGMERVLVLRDCQVMGITDRNGAQAALPAGSPSSKLNPGGAYSSLLQAAARYEESLHKGSDRAVIAERGEIIRLEGVSVAYGATRVLDEVNWTVRAGERWALTGPNGAGKTTLVSLVLGDHPQAYANKIWLFGKRRGSGESIWEIKARQGWVSPELQIHFTRAMSCIDVVCSGYFDSVGLYRRVSEEHQELAEEWLRALDAPAPGSSFTGLSAGQQRLVLLARALVKHPPLLVLDEPLQGLDAEHRNRFLGLLDFLCLHSSLSLIFISHYADEIPAAVTRRLELENGKVSGRKPQIYTDQSSNIK